MHSEKSPFALSTLSKLTKKLTKCGTSCAGQLLMAAIAAAVAAKKRAAGHKPVPFVVPELPWKKEVSHENKI